MSDQLRFRKMAARRACDAFEVHRALILAERRNPSLRDNPNWNLHRMDAFEAFYRAFEVM